MQPLLQPIFIKSIDAEPIVFTFIILSARREQLLYTARQKLLAADVPFLLRVTAFLRLSCLALGYPETYPRLMQGLCDHNPEWWHTCDVTATGVLESADPEIQQRLAIVLQAHSTQAAQ